MYTRQYVKELEGCGSFQGWEREDDGFCRVLAPSTYIESILTVRGTERINQDWW